MLDFEPRFLPLLPLDGTATSRSSYNRPRAPDRSPVDLPVGCSISALRQSFQPFPMRRLPTKRSRASSTTLELVVRPSQATGRGEKSQLRPMRRADVAQVKRLQDACLPISYPASFYTHLLTNSASLCLLACSPSSPSALLGCISGHLTSAGDVSLSASVTPALPAIYVSSLAVDSLARHQGLATQLIRELLRRLLLDSSARPVFSPRAVVSLHVESRNVNALSLYKKIGLSERRRIRGFYRRSGGDGEAIEMQGVLAV
ncbi:hypothetical protein JCM1841_003455 [Sporobolomyces salmonicolor]